MEEGLVELHDVSMNDQLADIFKKSYGKIKVYQASSQDWLEEHLRHQDQGGDWKV